MADRSFCLVLDTSAIVAYTRGSIHVGEPLTEIVEEGGLAALPVLCLAEAGWMAADPARLKLLIEHPATTSVPAIGEWRGLAETHEIVGNLDAATAVQLALDEDCCLLTARPGLYAGLGQDEMIIEA